MAERMNMHTYLLSLAEMHSAGPGSLDVIFGPDGDFEGAPPWRCPIWYTYGSPRWYVMRGGDWCVRLDGRGHWVGFTDLIGHIKSCYLDCRIPSIAARLLRLCSFVQDVDPNAEPDEIAALTLALAPRIAALGGTQ